MRLAKAAAILGLLAVSGAIFTLHSTGQIFLASLPLLLVPSATVVLAVCWHKPQRTWPWLVIGIGGPLIYRLLAFYWPASSLGFDPDKYAIRIGQMLQAGGIGVIDSTFYSRAAAFPLLGGASVAVTGLDPMSALIIIPLLAGVGLPLFGVLLAYELGSTPRGMVLAGTLSAVGPVGLKFSMMPIAQTVAVVLVLGVIAVLVRQYRTGSDRRLTAIGLMLSLAALLTHKLPALPIIASVAMLVVISWVQRHAAIRRRLDPPNHGSGAIGWLGLIIIVAAWVQWSASGFLPSAVFLTLESIFGQSSPQEIIVRCAHPAFESGLHEILFRRAHALVLALAAACATAYLVIRMIGEQRIDATVGIAAVGAGFVVLGLAGGLSFERPLFYVETMLLVVVAIGVAMFLSGTDGLNTRSRQAVGAVAVCLLLLSQVLAPAAAPDSPHQPRYYLTAQETQAKQWTNSQFEGESVSADGYIATEVISVSKALQNRRANYQDVSVELLTCRLDTVQTPILWRTNVGIYYLPGVGATGTFMWELNGEVNRDLNYERGKIYTNGGAEIFTILIHA